MAKPQYTAEFRQDIINQFLAERRREPGLTRAEFARQAGLAEGTFNSWLSRHGVLTSPPTRARSSPGAGGAPLTVSLADARRGSLVRFAVGALMHPSVIDLTQLAQSSGTSNRQLRVMLRRGSNESSDPGPDFNLVRNVQRAVHAASDVFDDPPPYPIELHEELLGEVDGSGVRIPASWLPDLCSSPPVRTTDVFARGDSLFALASSVSDEQQFADLRGRYRDEITDTIKYLYDVAVQSPRVGTRAIHLLSRLGRLALDPTEAEGTGYINNIVRRAPLGYRAIRVMSRILTLELRHGTASAEVLHTGAAERVVKMTRELHLNSPEEFYGDRSLFIECLWKLGSLPSLDQQATVIELLRRRLTRNGERYLGGPSPFREAAYAAVLLEERAPGCAIDLLERSLVPAAANDPDGCRFLRLTLSRLRDSVDENGLALPDHEWTSLVAELSSASVAQRIHHRNGSRVVPNAARHGAQVLLACAFTDLHGSRRRRALETLRHAGLGSLVVKVASALLDSEDAPAWLKSQAAFCTGFSHEHAAVEMLARHVATTAEPSVRVAALQAIGDIGIRTATDLGHDAAMRLSTLEARSWSAPERRALAYALACIRSGFRAGSPAAETRLASLSSDADSLTRGVAMWGLERLRKRRQPISPSRIPSALLPDDAFDD